MYTTIQSDSILCQSRCQWEVEHRPIAKNVPNELVSPLIWVPPDTKLRSLDIANEVLIGIFLRESLKDLGRRQLQWVLYLLGPPSIHNERCQDGGRSRRSRNFLLRPA